MGQQMPSLTPWSWSPDGKLLAAWQFDPQVAIGGVVIYSFAEHRYERLTTHGMNPIWLRDSRRLIFADLGKLYLLDTITRQEREIHNVGRNGFGVFALSRDNRRLFYSLISAEADIHMLSLN